MATIRIEKNIMVPMRDGVHLGTDVYRLEGAGAAPVLLTRTPCDKEYTLRGSTTLGILHAVQAGYVVVIRDVRGRYASEGIFNAHGQESQAGADVIGWLAVQPWSSGLVGGFGGSYLGCTRWLAARERPPALRALAPSVNPADMYNECSYQGGVKVLHDLRWVSADIIPSELRRRADRGEAVPDIAASFDLDSIFSELPLGSHPLIPEAAPFYAEWLAHDMADAYWQPISPAHWMEPSLIYFERTIVAANGMRIAEVAVVEREENARRYEAQGFHRCSYAEFRAAWRARDMMHFQRQMGRARTEGAQAGAAQYT